MNVASVSRFFLALAVLAVLPSCGASCWHGGIPLRPEGEFAAQAHAAADVREARNVTVYRGLAHPKNEKRLYARQLKSVPHTYIHGFEFFSKPADVSPGTVKRVLALYAEPSSHQAYSKKDVCSFHPDYALVWKTGAEEHVLQICYGCHEWRYYCGRGVLMTDINEPAYFDKLTQWMPAANPAP